MTTNLLKRNHFNPNYPVAEQLKKFERGILQSQPSQHLLIQIPPWKYQNNV